MSWLPAFVEFDGDWNALDAYVERVYAVFYADFVARRPPTLNGARVSLRRYPELQGKSAAFWHLITEGKVEEDRYPVIERCRRIAWPRAILERAVADRSSVRAWRNERARGERLLIATLEFDYVVVLDVRQDKEENRRFYLLLTAYPVEEQHRREKLRDEHDEWHRRTGTKG